MLDKNDEIEEKYFSECIMFLGFSTLGLMMLTSASELISIVIALEISSYSLYVIVPLRKGQTKIQLEASMKYLFFGAISTGIMLYGMSYIYGMTQSTNLTEILYTFPKYLTQPMGVFALVLTLTGFFFKLSLFPMHFWAPDIYEGASNTTTTFIATIPKIAAAAILIRITLVASSMNIQFVNILMVLRCHLHDLRKSCRSCPERYKTAPCLFRYRARGLSAAWYPCRSPKMATPRRCFISPYISS